MYVCVTYIVYTDIHLLCIISYQLIAKVKTIFYRVSVLSEETVKTLRCSTFLHNFCQATMTAITWLKHNCCKVLLVLILCITLPAVSVGLLCAAFKCSTHECYLYIKGIPVMICTTGMIFIPLVLAIFLCIYFIYMAITGQQKQYWNKVSTVIELFFSSFLKKPNSENDEEKLTVLGYEVSLKEMHWLIFTLAQASLLAFAQFWDDFLLEVSSSCSTDSNLHCFYTTTSRLSYRELNCLNTRQVKKATSIICYKYVFNIGHAAASAIGIISATGLIIYIVCVVFLRVLNGARLSKWSIRLVKGVAVLEVILFCSVVSNLQANYTSPATGTFGIITSIQKTQGMGAMIVTSIICFPVDKFRKSRNRDGYEPITNEPRYETV